MNLDPPEIFNYLSHKIVKYLERSCSYGEEGKHVSIDLNNEEHALIFKIDGGYINDRNKKADILVYYCNLGKKLHRLMIIELKGRDVKHAIKQIEDTIKNPLFRDFWNKFDGIKSVGIIASKSSPGKRDREMADEFRKRNNIPIIIKHKATANIREFFS